MEIVELEMEELMLIMDGYDPVCFRVLRRERQVCTPLSVVK